MIINSKLVRKNKSYYIINGITVYRIAASVVLLYLILSDKPGWFKWLLPVSFFTDLIDGYLARKFKVRSISGAKLDSIGDDLTVLMAFAGALAWKPGFIYDNIVVLIIPLALFFIQLIFALVRYRKTTSYHTYLAKLAAILQGSFFILLFILPQPPLLLFYFAVVVTSVELIEEIIIVSVMKEWKADVKGLYWVLKSR